MNASVARGRRLGNLIVMAIILDFVFIVTVRAIHTSAPPPIDRASPSIARARAIEAQSYWLDATMAPGFIDQAFPVSGGQIPLPRSRRIELRDAGDIDVYGWALFAAPPDPKLASVTYATVDGHFAGAGEPYTRADVGTAYHDPHLDGSGFIIRVRVKMLGKGAHVLRVFVCDSAAKERRIFADPVTFVIP
jgi:hypothetical protein